MTQQDPRIAERYAAHSSVWPKVFLAVGVLVPFLLAIWLAWAVYVHSTPQVTSDLSTWKVVDDHTVDARLEVDLRSGAKSPRCLLRAYAEDHTIVGDKSFVPSNGRNDVSIRTERLATSVEKIGCTTADQNDAR
ncbi:hypothetical protein JCM18899A_26900 [Nocardioides sp. AN3]